MDTKHITAVHYVHAADPIGRLILQKAGDLWSGDSPDPKSEYLRGQVETIADTVRVLSDHELPDEDFEATKERIVMLIEAASQGTLDAALNSLFSPNHDWCTACEAVTEYDGDECLRCGRLWGYDEPPKPHYPDVEVSLVNVDGNALMLHAHVAHALKEAGVPGPEREKFFLELTSGDYDNVLATIYRWVTVV